MTMATNNPLKEGLLDQAQHNGTGSGDVNLSIQAVLARNETRVKRMKKLTVMAWLVLPLSFLIFVGIKSLSDSMLVEPVAVIVIQAVLLIAVSFTISLYVRSQTLTMNQIQLRLTHIENLLKQAMQDKQGS
jgi:hypothetical protein